MKALSLRQPWAEMVVRGGKTIENRRWDTQYRGPFLIHAAKGMSRDEYDDAIEFALGVDPRIVVPPFEGMVRGGIVGSARIVRVIPPCATVLDQQGLFDTPVCSHPWHMPLQFGFVLEGVEPASFFPWKGALGFFEIPDEKLPADLRRRA